MSDDIVDRLERWTRSDGGIAAPAELYHDLRASVDEIERLRADLESERAEHEAWKRLAQIPEPITPEDIGMVRVTYEDIDKMEASGEWWRFPDDDE